MIVSKIWSVSPKIMVCGLNPHAGESGYLGREEIDIINPVLQHYRDQGIDIGLAMPADTLFTQNISPLPMHYRHVSRSGTGTAQITWIWRNGEYHFRDCLIFAPPVDRGTALDLAGTGQSEYR